MTAPIRMIESDHTPKYGIAHLYHYTVYQHLDSILSSGYIKAGRCVSSTTRHAVWMTTNPLREFSIWHRKHQYHPFVPVQFKVKDRPLKARSFDFISYAEFCNDGGYLDAVSKWLLDGDARKRLERLYAQVDSGDVNTKEWFLSLRNVPTYFFEEPKVLYENKWAGIENLEKAVAAAKSHEKFLAMYGIPK